MSSKTAQAPDVNFVAAITIKTIPVTVAPMELMMALPNHPGGLSRRQRCTMPNWDKVNDVNTPIAYNGSKACSRASNRITSTAEQTPSATMPLEKLSRSPRWANWRGRKRSVDRKYDNRGKSAKAVLDARI